MTFYQPTRDEVKLLLGDPGRFREFKVVEGALPPGFILERACPPDASSWLTPRLFCDEATAEIVGSGGFKSAPVNGSVEIGYGVAPGARGRGHATSAVALLVDEAFASGAVTAVTAKTARQNAASRCVLRKCGFIFCALGDDHGMPAEVWSFRPSPWREGVGEPAQGRG